MRLFFYNILILLFFLWTPLYTIAQCDNDTTEPLAVCNDQVRINVTEEGVDILPDLIDAGSFDSCTESENLSFRVELQETSKGTVPDSVGLVLFEPGTYGINLWVIDEAGNTTVCWSQIRLINESACQGDSESPSLSCLSSLQTIENEVLVFAQDFIKEASDNCTDQPDFTYGLELAENFTGSMPTEAILEITTPGVYAVYVWVADQQGNSTYCKSQLIASEAITVEGFVYNDANQNCNREVEETGLSQFVKITVLEGGIPIYTITEKSNNGAYSARVLKPTTVDGVVEVQLANDAIAGCEDVQSTTIPLVPTGPIQVGNLGTQLTEGCADLGITIEGVHAECDDAGFYVLQIHNLGSEITNPTITLEFTYAFEFFDFSADFSANFATDNFQSYSITRSDDSKTYIIELSNVLPGEEGTIFLLGKEVCEIENQTQVVTASIAAENACSNLWEGAEVKITQECLGDEVEFRFINVGKEDMVTPTEYIVIEDVIMMRQGNIQLSEGQSQGIRLPANGATYHVSARQSNDYPWQATTTIVSEGCSTNPSNITTGLVSKVSLANLTPHIDVAVIENQSSFINKLTALPKGIGEEHLIDVNTPIEYTIEYANEGNEVINNALITVELSEHLDLSQLDVTYSSQTNYNLSIDKNTLSFSFPNIGLVSTSINEEEGSGLLKFVIAQKQDVPVNTLIESTTAVQFNEESPRTSSIFHTVGKLELSTSLGTVIPNTIDLNVSPNPFSTYTTFTFENDNQDWMQFELYDVNGATIWEQQLNTNQLRLPRTNLHNGFYFYVLKKEGIPVGVGKLFVE